METIDSQKILEIRIRKNQPIIINYCGKYKKLLDLATLNAQQDLEKSITKDKLKVRIYDTRDEMGFAAGSDAAKKIKEFSVARSAFYVDTDGEDFFYIKDCLNYIPSAPVSGVTPLYTPFARSSSPWKRTTENSVSTMTGRTSLTLIP